MELKNLLIAISPVLGAAIVVLGLLVPRLLKASTDSLMIDHAGSPLFENPSSGAAGAWIGSLERILFTLAIVVDYPLAIGGGLYSRWPQNGKLGRTSCVFLSRRMAWLERTRQCFE